MKIQTTALNNSLLLGRNLFPTCSLLQELNLVCASSRRTQNKRGACWVRTNVARPPVSFYFEHSSCHDFNKLLPSVPHRGFLPKKERERLWGLETHPNPNCVLQVKQRQPWFHFTVHLNIQIILDPPPGHSAAVEYKQAKTLQRERLHSLSICCSSVTEGGGGGGGGELAC